jgi:hypothetical protein
VVCSKLEGSRLGIQPDLDADSITSAETGAKTEQPEYNSTRVDNAQKETCQLDPKEP